MEKPTDDGGLRLLVVGLDAGCRTVLEPLFDSGAVPTLRRLVETGTSGPLRSQIPPWTASAWPSLYTGKNPGKHGVYDFLSFDGYDWDVVDGTDVRERSIWELLSEHGISSVVVNVPVTHPPRAFDGALIPGLTAPEDPPCHPDGILEDVESACGDYSVYPQSTPAPDRSIDGYERVVECRGTAFRHLCRRIDPEFGFLQFQQTDSVFHERPGDGAVVEAVYREVDRQLARTLDETDPDNVLLVSDHGIGRVTGHEFRINEFLRERGDVKVRRNGSGMPAWTKTWETELLDGTNDADHEGSVLERAMRVASTVGLTTQRVSSVLEAVGLAEAIGKRVPNHLIRAASERVDFAASRAFVRSKSELGVRINLEGREPDGQVPPSEYDAVRSELIERLSAVTTPDGDPMFETVAPRETFFTGPHVDEAPDVMTVPTGFDNAIVADVGRAQFGEPMEPWNHTRTGIVAASGVDFDEEATLEGATVFDVAPTICALFDVPIDAEMDGTTLPVIEDGTKATYPTYQSESIRSTTNDTVEDRLSDLGYL